MGKFPEETFVENRRIIVVGKNGVGDFTRIQEALDECAKEESEVTLVILSGEYEENILLYQSDIQLIGVGTVKIIGCNYAKQVNEKGTEIGTFQTATVFINGENVWLENIEIINNAGPGEKAGQAIALYNEGTNNTFKRCIFRGYQDTLCLGPLPDYQKDGTLFSTPKFKKEFTRKRTTFQNCYIEGTVDFIFGGGESVFEQCEIKSLLRPMNKEGYITAASTPKDNNGFYFNKCYLTADLDVENVYLGRPWRPFANVTFSNCIVGRHIAPSRWDDWGNTNNRQSVRFMEENNTYLMKEPLQKLNWTYFKE